MTTLAQTRARLLRRIMDQRKLNSVQVGAIVCRQPQTVRAWLCGARCMPPELLAKLILHPNIRFRDVGPLVSRA